jgi:hypothetical protein
LKNQGQDLPIQEAASFIGNAVAEREALQSCLKFFRQQSASYASGRTVAAKEHPGGQFEKKASASHPEASTDGS